MFLPLAPDYTEHNYSAVNKSRKVASRESHEHSETKHQVVAVYGLATAVEQEDSTLKERILPSSVEESKYIQIYIRTFYTKLSLTLTTL